MLDSLNELLWIVSTYLWGLPLSLLLASTGLYLTLKLRFIQVRGFGRAFGFIFPAGQSSDWVGQSGRATPALGELNYYQALSTVLSSTIGTGNIVGVATAISVGGPGALLWMWVVALLGMATKYSECVLALVYREQSKYGHTRGGPMYYIENGLGQRYRPLALIFSACAAIAALGTGDMVQSNAISSALAEPLSRYISWSPSVLRGLIGIALFTATVLVIIGGLSRIAAVASYLVPFMVVSYLLAGLISLTLNSHMIIPALWEIIYCTPSPRAVAGGFAGGGVWLAMRMGVARGTFSNEAGLGSAPIAYATIKTDHPVKGGLVALMEPFVDTILVCTMTALVVITSDLWKGDISGAVLTSRAFQAQLPYLGGLVVPLSLTLFAYTSILGWYYYGERCVEYLLGAVSIPFYKAAFLLALLVGAVAKLEIVWNFADLANALMALPNLLALLLLSNVVRERTEDYFRKNM
ncbi:MAG TPA: alanine/glycine:cation symporter family protein [Candidatus Hypogeohydataceae bacterium YC40]